MERLGSLGRYGGLFQRYRRIRYVGGSHKRLHRAPTALAVLVDHDVMGDGEEPGAKGAGSASRSVAWQCGERVGEDDAGGVLRRLPSPQAVIAVAIDRIEIGLIERREGRRV